jgi:hypothetical protein
VRLGPVVRAVRCPQTNPHTLEFPNMNKR